jgi:hypothetical protein
MYKKRFVAMLDDDQLFFTNSYCIVNTRKSSKDFDDTMAVALLNSNVVQFLLHRAAFSTRSAASIEVGDINNLPLPDNLERGEEVSANVARLIESRTNSGNDESVFFDELNRNVYSMYNLTEEDVQLIESVVARV